MYVTGRHLVSTLVASVAMVSRCWSLVQLQRVLDSEVKNPGFGKSSELSVQALESLLLAPSHQHSLNCRRGLTYHHTPFWPVKTSLCSALRFP